MVIILVILILLGRFLIFSFSLNSLKPVIEDEISYALGMEITIEGNINARFLPSFSVVLDDIMLKNTDDAQIWIERAELQLPLSSLFSSEIKIRGLRINNPEVTVINRSVNSSIPAEKQTYVDVDSLDWGIDLVDVKIINGTFNFFDNNHRDTIIINGINIQSEFIYARGNTDTLNLGDLEARGLLTASYARINSTSLDNINLDLNIRNSKITISNKSEGLDAQENIGKAIIDFSSDIPVYSIRQDILQFRIEKFLTRFNDDTLIKGVMDFSFNVDFSGKTPTNRWLSSSGEISLKGKNLTLYGVNIDLIAQKYSRSQKFNLVDVGALLLAGPVGIAVTKGRDFADLLIANKGDSTQIIEFMSQWSLKAGELYVEDVAFSTMESRIALRGGLNIWQQKFNQLDFALVNDYGCAVFYQCLDGSFTSPEISEVKVAKTLLGPIKSIFTGKKCKEVFYEGTVLPVKQKD
jgi:AsmA protein